MSWLKWANSQTAGGRGTLAVASSLISPPKLIRRLAPLIICGLCPIASVATNHLIREDEVMAGLNGDPKIQFIQMTVSDGTQKSWGPQGNETSSRAMLVFFNGAGIETGRFFFPSNVPAGQN